MIHRRCNHVWGFLSLCTAGMVFAAVTYGAGASLINRSARRRPSWITRPIHSQTAMYFTGAKTKAQTFEEGRSEAIQNAVKDIVDYFGITAKTQYESVTTEIANSIMDRIVTKGEAEVRGITLKDSYYEEWLSNSGERTFDVFVLIEYSKDEIASEKERLRKENLARLKEIKNLLERAREDRSRGAITDAWQQCVLAWESAMNTSGSAEVSGEIAREARSLFGSFVLEKKNDPVSAGTEQGIKGGLAVSLSYQGSSGSIPVPQFPVSFGFVNNSGICNSPVLTDARGVAETAVMRINNPNPATSIAASVSPLPFADIPPRTVVFTVRVEGKPLTLLSQTADLYFGRGTTNFRIPLLHEGMPQALLDISLGPAGRFLDVHAALVTQWTGITESGRETGPLVITENRKGSVRFAADRDEQVKEMIIAPLRLEVDIRSKKTRTVSTQYTGAFEAFDAVTVHIGVYHQ